ncbi:uncharacterized protein PFL1_00822 [Pseudozyma flocculosa PF-1]|uniref:uncharacterized protein n=1 Tax=Pseudozyma flocculosa PF-1 TaxID=1277687 RepID=UPI0004561A48|nr:uncharacterized protein PFL1_00822 [Pseudozyma flocculosa PF-1]EPQ31487.1 hypothetical protein PFL1_00822 [Pseudozyma flocculosa PF-1]
MSVTAQAGLAGLDALKARQSQLQAERASLKVELANVQALPADLSDVKWPGLDEENDRLGRELASMEDKTVIYRSAGWTCFEIDLDVGRRARETRKELKQEPDDVQPSNNSGLGLGIRLDTFFRGRYYEPYYLVFARPSQMVDAPRLAGTTLGEPNADFLDTVADGLLLIRHTMPHFVPLVGLLERYIPAVLDGSASGGGSGSGQRSDGGLSLLADFHNLPGVEAFLSALHCHLQAFVSRREQVVALSQAELPDIAKAGGGGGTPAPASLNVAGSDAFDLIRVVWQIPQVFASDQGSGAQKPPAAGPDVDPATAEPAAKRRRGEEQAVQSDVDAPRSSLEVLVHYTDRRADRLTDPTLKPQDAPSQDPGEEEVAEGPPQEPFQGTTRPFGRVRVELVVAPSLVERTRAGTRDAGPAALEPGRTRRKDLEELFAQEVEGEGLELDEALEVVADRVWQERGGDADRILVRSRKKRPSARTAPEHPRGAYEPDRKRRQHPPALPSGRLNPDPYSDSPPNFAALADLYPLTLGKHIKRRAVPGDAAGSRAAFGHADATLDFQDAQAVRCLSETLLYHDFGLTVRLHEARLCPTIPNRLNYILYLRKVLDCSSSCSRVIATARQARSAVSREEGAEQRDIDVGRRGVRGLDIGTGASAIYPLLGCAVEPDWTFVATDIDSDSLAHARQTIEDPANNRSVVVSSSRTTAQGDQHGPVTVDHALAQRVQLLLRSREDCLIPSDGEVASWDGPVRFDFTMCNPPFYLSEEDMRYSASFKTAKPNAVCHGSENEMVTEGGEVAFVLRMVRESALPANRQRVGWYTSMLGKLSSVSAVVDGIKSHGIDNWAVTKLVQGQTGRWVVSWSFAGVRLPDSLCRLQDSKLEASLPPSNIRTCSFAASQFDSALAILEAIKAVLLGLDDCHAAVGEAGRSVDVMAWRQSWTRSARRQKARRQGDASAASARQADQATGEEQGAMSEPEVCLSFCVEAGGGQARRAGAEEWRVEAQWTWGRRRVVFESFAAHVLRKLADWRQDDGDARGRGRGPSTTS